MPQFECIILANCQKDNLTRKRRRKSCPGDRKTLEQSVKSNVKLKTTELQHLKSENNILRKRIQDLEAENEILKENSENLENDIECLLKISQTARDKDIWQRKKQKKSVHEIPELYTITYTQLKTMKIKERERNADRGLRRFKSMSDGFNIQCDPNKPTMKEETVLKTKQSQNEKNELKQKLTSMKEKVTEQDKSNLLIREVANKNRLIASLQRELSDLRSEMVNKKRRNNLHLEKNDSSESEGLGSPKVYTSKFARKLVRKKSAGHDTEWTNYSRGSNIEEWICVMDRYHDLKMEYDRLKADFRTMVRLQDGIYNTEHIKNQP